MSYRQAMLDRKLKQNMESFTFWATLKWLQDRRGTDAYATDLIAHLRAVAAPDESPVDVAAWLEESGLGWSNVCRDGRYRVGISDQGMLIFNAARQYFRSADREGRSYRRGKSDL